MKCKYLLISLLLATSAQAYEPYYDTYSAEDRVRQYEQEKAQERRRELDNLNRNTQVPQQQQRPQNVRCYEQAGSVYCERAY